MYIYIEMYKREKENWKTYAKRKNYYKENKKLMNKSEILEYEERQKFYLKIEKDKLRKEQEENNEKLRVEKIRQENNIEEAKKQLNRANLFFEINKGYYKFSKLIRINKEALEVLELLEIFFPNEKSTFLLRHKVNTKSMGYSNQIFL